MAYSGMTTKVRALSGKLLSEENFRELLEQPGVPEAVTFLKQFPEYADILKDTDENRLHRKDVELLLRSSIYRNYSKLYNFASRKQRTFLKTYFMRYEVYFLKLCLTNILDPRDTFLDTHLFEDYFSSHSDLDLRSLVGSRTPAELTEHLKGTPYFHPMDLINRMENPTLFDYETALDLVYSKTLWDTRLKISSAGEAEYLTKVLGTRFDLLNLQWICRAKHFYHMDDATIYAMLLPVKYKLPAAKIRELVETTSPEALEHAVSTTYYAGRYKDLTSETIGALYSQIMKKMLTAECRKDPYSVSSVYNYLYHKEHEVDRLTIALECIRYKLSAGDAIQRLQAR